MELNGSLTNTELDKPHPSRLLGGAEMWSQLVPHAHVDKNSGGISWERGAPAQGSSARKISLHDFRLQKPAGTEWNKLLDPRQFLSHEL